MATTFTVSTHDQKGALLSPTKPLPMPVESAREAFGSKGVSAVRRFGDEPPPRLGAFPVESASMNAPLAGLCSEVNGLVATVGAAFDLHAPLVLSPDDVWLTIAQGFARHVAANAEELRQRFVTHQGKETLEVRRDDFVKGLETNPWPEVFAAFSAQVAERVPRAHPLVVANFSTTGPVERAASEVALLDVAGNYFTFQFLSMCGIPSLTLLGTSADWRSVRARAAVLAEYELGWWTGPLTEVLDQFVAASEGRVDSAFWQSMYSDHGASGGPYVSGWLQVFFPYLENDADAGRFTRRADHLSLWRVKRRRPTDTVADERGRLVGPETRSLPPSVSEVHFTWTCLDQTYPMQFLAGIVGATQDPQTLAVRPVIGWAVREMTDATQAGVRR